MRLMPDTELGNSILPETAFTLFWACFAAFGTCSALVNALRRFSRRLRATESARKRQEPRSSG
eukprot:14474375-Alexandrium_andersonii.AAC.1